MKTAILTLFPEIFKGFFDSSLVRKARERKLFSAELINIRDFADPPHYQVDDTPYGGGAGMVMRPEPLMRAIESAQAELPAAKVILLSASGSLFTQRKAQEFSEEQELILICGRYEGIDQRVIDMAVHEQISIGDYVLMGGEIPAMVVLESSLRLVADVIGNQESLAQESFSLYDGAQPLLEGPHYTRPVEFRGMRVPDLLTSGNHEAIQSWRLEKAREHTARMRPDLLHRR